MTGDGRHDGRRFRVASALGSMGPVLDAPGSPCPIASGVGGGACPVCGFTPATVTPPDATTTLRSLPRRYAAALGPIGDDPRHEALLIARPAREPVSALDWTSHVTDALLAATAALRALRATSSDADAPELPVAGQPTPTADDDLPDPSLVLADLRAAAEGAAGAAEALPAQGWLTSGLLPDGSSRTAQDVVRSAAHEGVHHLRDVERVVAAARVEAGSD